MPGREPRLDLATGAYAGAHPVVAVLADGDVIGIGAPEVSADSFMCVRRAAARAVYAAPARDGSLRPGAYGTRMSLPVVRRPARSSWARGADASGYSAPTRTCRLALTIASKMSEARHTSSVRSVA